jgi:hypothetical protein
MSSWTRAASDEYQSPNSSVYSTRHRMADDIPYMEYRQPSWVGLLPLAED